MSVGFGVAEDYEPQRPDPSYVAKMFGPGIHGFFAYDESRLVGMARVLSDDICASWIAEVCVLHEWQRQGIGRTLLEMITERFPHTAIYTESLPSSVDFFARLGIRPRPMLVACAR